MNNQDYIRKAVELADGWNEVGDHFHAVHIPDLGDCAVHHGIPSQWMVDALAAQLVRQVDALTTHHVVSRSGEVRVIKFDADEDEASTKGSAYGTDRTMNTIKAIVDSKILEQKKK